MAADGTTGVTGGHHDALARLRNRYQGERLFIVGDGPSISDAPLHLLADEHTLGIERFYRNFDRIRWRPELYTVTTAESGAEVAVRGAALGRRYCFLPDRLHGHVPDADNVIWYATASSDALGHRTDPDIRDGVIETGTTTGAALQIALHLGFDEIYLLGCDLDICDDAANGLAHCRSIAERAGKAIFDATGGSHIDVYERVNVRTLFTRRALVNRLSPDRAPGTSRGVPVPEREHVAGHVLVDAVLGLDHPGLALDIGAGSGDRLASLAAAGWEVRAVEPDPASHDSFVAALPPAWPVVVDPRAVGCVETTAPWFSFDAGGGSLVPRTAGSVSSATVTVTTPDAVLSLLNGRVPDIVLISAAGWELEILRAYPWASARPQAAVVAVNDRVSPRFGFRGRDLARLLGAQDYDVFVLTHHRTHPNSAVQRVQTADDADGAWTELIALPRGLATAGSLDACRRAVLAGRRDETARTTLRGGRRAGDDRSGKAPPRRGGGEDPEAELRELRQQVDAMRASTSWRLGHGLVLGANRSRIVVGNAIRTARRLARRAVRGGGS